MTWDISELSDRRHRHFLELTCDMGNPFKSSYMCVCTLSIVYYAYIVGQFIAAERRFSHAIMLKTF